LGIGPNPQSPIPKPQRKNDEKAKIIYIICKYIIK
jgi:hypothetical protein